MKLNRGNLNLDTLYNDYILTNAFFKAEMTI